MNTNNLIKRCKANNIVCDINERWEAGTPHHPEALLVFELISASDSVFCNNYFDFRSGGDGDIGESLMHGLSIMLELRDAEKK